MGVLTSDDDVINIIWRAPERQVVVHPVNVVDVEEQALWSPKQSRVVLDGLPFCRRVDNAEHLSQVIEQQLLTHQQRRGLWFGSMPAVILRLPYLKIQHFILLFHGRQKGVLGKVIRSRQVLLVCPLDLLFKRLDALRQQTRQLKIAALLRGEGRSLIKISMVQQHSATEGAFEGAARA